MQTLIFDFGNVVGFFDHRLTFERLAAHTPMPIEDMYRLAYTGDLETAFESGQLSVVEFLAQVRGLCGLRCDDAFMETAIADIFEPNPEVCALIPQLKGKYRLLLGSNTNEIHSRKFLVQFADVLGHFDHLVLSHRIRSRKPAAEFFHHCVGLASCPAQECLFIDDLPPNIAGARAAGLQGLLYEPGGNLTRQLRTLGISV